MSKPILILLFVLLIVQTIGQTTFERVIYGQADQLPTDIIEIDGYYYVSIVNDQEWTSIIKLNEYGIVTDSLKIMQLGEVHIISKLLGFKDNMFIALGKYSQDTSDYIWFLKLDTNLNILQEKKQYVKGFSGMYISGILSSYNTIILTEYIQLSQWIYKPYICELDISGNLLIDKQFDNPGDLCFTYDIIEDTLVNHLKIFSLSEFIKSEAWIVNLDTSFNIQNQHYSNEFGDQNTAKWISSTKYILSAKDVAGNASDMKVFIMSSNDSIIISEVVAGSDKFEYPGIDMNLDFNSLDHIFYGGMLGNDWPNPYSTLPNYLLLYSIDTNLNINWQRTYGGEASYWLTNVLATSDGGCILLSGIFEVGNPINEMDVHILKVDYNGFVTEVQEEKENIDSVSVHPNPAHSNVEFSLLYPHKFNIQLLNSRGQVVINKDLEGSKFILSIGHLATGIYFYKITSVAFCTQGKLIISH